MELDVQPPLAPEDVEVLQRALARSGVSLDDGAMRLRTAWWRSGIEEAIEAAERPEPSLYAPSPRRTRGATRA